MTTLMVGAAETVITSIKDRPDVYAELYARVLVLADGQMQTRYRNGGLRAVFTSGTTRCYSMQSKMPRAYRQSKSSSTVAIHITLRGLMDAR